MLYVTTLRVLLPPSPSPLISCNKMNSENFHPVLMNSKARNVFGVSTNGVANFVAIWVQIIDFAAETDRENIFILPKTPQLLIFYL